MAHTTLTFRTAFGEGAGEHLDTLRIIERALDSDPNVLEYRFDDIAFAPDQQVYPNTPIESLPSWVDERIAALNKPSILILAEEMYPGGIPNEDKDAEAIALWNAKNAKVTAVADAITDGNFAASELDTIRRALEEAER